MLDFIRRRAIACAAVTAVGLAGASASLAVGPSRAAAAGTHLGATAAASPAPLRRATTAAHASSASVHRRATTTGRARATASARALTKLRRTLKSDLTDTTKRAGALVIDERTGSTLFSYNAGIPRIPASVQKLYTTATALVEFGPNARFRTRIYGTGRLAADGTWRGTLYLRGGGDPTFGARSFNDLMYGTGVGATVQRLAANLKAHGVRRVAGTILGDESYFDTLRGGPDTGYRADLETEGELSALAYNDGFTSVHATALQRKPVMTATHALVAALRRAGISVPKSTRVSWGRTPARARLITGVGSPKLSTLVYLTNSPSDNFFAEMLLKNLGGRFGGAGSTAAGATVVRAQIGSHFGLHPTLDDGSGLSRYDHTSPSQVVSLLRGMQSNPAFYNSLAIAGVRGTMVHEMLGTRAVNNCRGKTGTLHDTASLVGYCTARNGDPLVFAFLMNGLGHNSALGHQLEDKMGVALANYNG
jgi:D-alanyl-D-alanine carboxypeptidase/D-alanyl-D-alanine-endopeptidase (penicillin-binding protein 4)